MARPIAARSVAGSYSGADSMNTVRAVRDRIHHCAFEYASMDGLLDTYVRLKAAGMAPHACLDHRMTTSFCYVDPDGNSVELQSDNFGWAKSTDYMRTMDEFAANPIGVPIDPDQMVGARDAGASADDLHRRAYAGEFMPDTTLDLRVPLS
ncbi:MAG: hypothetical protein QOJ21_1936 [Solirubrobacteraceae bacterium]|nr:hypothetical protein [Solirubrobacteraceae bacterium]